MNPLTPVYNLRLNFAIKIYAKKLISKYKSKGRLTLALDVTFSLKFTNIKLKWEIEIFAYFKLNLIIERFCKEKKKEGF